MLPQNPSILGLLASRNGCFKTVDFQIPTSCLLVFKMISALVEYS